MTITSLILPEKPKSDAERLLATVAALPADTGITVFGNRILVAKYVRQTVGTSGRILASVETQREDRWQGKVGVVVAVGPLAFVDDAANDFKGQSVKPGDWVLFNYGDGSDLDLVLQGAEKIPCKMIKDVEIHGVITRPESIY